MSRSLNPPRISPLSWILLTLLAVLGAITCAGPLFDGIRARSWVQTTARILRWENAQQPGRLEEVAILYQYKVGGRDFFGTRVDLMEGSEQMERGPDCAPGHEVTCFVNPNNPSEALLRRDMTFAHWLCPLTFIIAAAGFGYAARRALLQKRIADAATLFTLETAVTDRSRRKRVA